MGFTNYSCQQPPIIPSPIQFFSGLWDRPSVGITCQQYQGYLKEGPGFVAN